jgi:hypothetical protein
MPSAPHILNVESPSVEPSGAPPNDYENIHANPAQFGGLLGEAAQKLGQGVERAGQDAAEAWLDTANKQNQIWASQAHSDFQNKASPILENYLTLQGQAAVNARPDVQKQITDLQQAAIDAAPSLNTKMLLSENLRRTTDFMNSRIVSHAAQQTNTWNKAVAQGGQEAAANQGTLAAATGGAPDFGYMDAQLRQVDIESHNRYGEAFDLNNPEQKTAFDAQVAKDNGHAVALWVAAKAGDQKDPNAIEHAMQIFERYGDHIDPETRQKIGDFIVGKGEDHYAHMEAIRKTSPLDAGAVHEGANFMHPGAQYGTLGPGRELDPSHLSEITLSNGQKATVNKASAPAFTGFLNELVDDGAPIGNIGGYNPRPGGIGGHGMMSQHTMGNAIDIGSQTGRDIVSSDFRQWVKDNPDKWRTALNRWSIYSGGDWSHPDLGHIEWAGGAPGTWTANGQPLPDASAVTQSIMNDPKYAGRPELQDKVLRFSLSRLNLLRAGNADQAADVQNMAQIATERARNGDFSIPFPDDRLGVLGMRQAEQARLVYQSARREGEFQNAGALAPQAEAEALFDQIQNNPNADEAEKAKDVAAATAFMNKRNAALGLGPNGPTSAADPAKWIAAHDPGTHASLMALNTKNPPPAIFENYARGVLAQQQRMGLTEQQTHVLTREVATNFANSVVNSGDSKKALDALQQQTGAAWPHVFRDMVQYGNLPMAYQGVSFLNTTRSDGSMDPQGSADAALLSRWLREGRTAEKEGSAKDFEEKLNSSLGARPIGGQPPATAINSLIDTNQAGLGQLWQSMQESGVSRPRVDALRDSVKQLAYAKVYYDHETPNDAANHAAEAFTRNWQFMPTGSARVPADRYDTVNANAQATLDFWKANPHELNLPPDYRQSTDDKRHGVAEASEYVGKLEANPHWITSPHADALWLKDDQGYTVKDKRGNPVSVPFNAELMQPARRPPAFSGAAGAYAISP